VVLLRRYIEPAKTLAQALRDVADELDKLAKVRPPAGRKPTAHPELAQIARRFERVAATLKKAVAARHMSAAQYATIARQSKLNAEAFKKGAAKELANSKRRGAGGASKRRSR
jgi:methyl-accepting chemotaxis protein